ncbi:hypothetical protein AVEN_10224-1, partial [Araneus ventricosus]
VDPVWNSRVYGESGGGKGVVPSDTCALELSLSIYRHLGPYQWSAKLNDNNTVFQNELTALHEAVIFTTHLPNHSTSKIHVETASIMASSNSKSTNETARKSFKILLTNPRITVSWVKAHAGNIDNERADQLAKDATQHGQPFSFIKLPKPDIKFLLRKRMLEEWKPYGRMAMQALKYITSCPQLFSVPLTGLERMLSSSLNMSLSLPTSKGFTCLTTIFAAVVELARHFTMPRSVFTHCLGI